MSPLHYRVVIEGRVSARFVSALAGVELETAGPRTSLLVRARDRAELYGVLDRLRDLGLDLVSLAPLERLGDEQGRGTIPG